jgi:hypothetical protein
MTVKINGNHIVPVENLDTQLISKVPKAVSICMFGHPASLQ